MAMRIGDLLAFTPTNSSQSGTTQNFALPAGTSCLRKSGGVSALTFGGIQPGARPSRMIVLMPSDTLDLDGIGEDVGSSAANRFTESFSTPDVGRTAIFIWYSPTASRWRIVG